MNLRNFVINSDYPPDKCCWFYTGQNAIPASGATTVQITANDIDYDVVALGAYSADGGTTWIGMPGSQGNLTPQPVTLWLNDDGAGHPLVGITLQAGAGIAAGTAILFRIALILKEGEVGTVPKPDSGTTNFRFNSDYGYLSLVASGTWTPQASSSPQVLCQHNLGYKPLVLAWDDVSLFGAMKHVNLVYGDSTYQEGLYVTNSQLLMYCPAESSSMFPTTDIHWRLYGEQNG